MENRQIVVKVQPGYERAFAAMRNYALAQQLVNDALYSILGALRTGGLPIRLRAEQRLRAAEDDLRQAAAALDKVREEQEGLAEFKGEGIDACSQPPFGCTRHSGHPGPCAAVPQGRDEFSPKFDPPVSRGARVYGGNLGCTESLAEEMMP